MRKTNLHKETVHQKAADSYVFPGLCNNSRKIEISLYYIIQNLCRHYTYFGLFHIMLFTFIVSYAVYEFPTCQIYLAYKCLLCDTA